MMIFDFNGSEIIHDPANTIFKPFTDLLGSGFFVIPLSFIALALYMKTRNLSTVGLFMIVCGLLFSSSNIFIEYTPMVTVYILFAVLGFVSLLLGIFGIRRGV